MLAIVFVFVFIAAHKVNILSSKYFLFLLLVTFTLASLFLFETYVLLPEDSFYRLDEDYFRMEVNHSFAHILENHRRYLLFVLYSKSNYFLFGEFGLKIQSIPFVLLTSILLYKVTQRKISLVLFPIVFLYVVFLSALLMRDAMLVFFTLYFIYLCVNAKGNIKFILFTFCCVFFFLFIRPEAAVLFAASALWFSLYKIFGVSKKINFVYLPLIFILLFVSPFYNYLIDVAGYVVGVGRLSIFAELKSDSFMGIPFLNQNIQIIIRQIITPVPTSKLYEMIYEGVSSNFYLYEISRMVLMGAFYFGALFLMFRPGYVMNVINKSDFVAFLILLATLYTVSYALYSEGGGDSRNKLYPFLLVFIILCYRHVKGSNEKN
ncbi:MAG: hypothetical protein JJU03_04675 [Idiomarina sp.]|nr:hypothetical protein [Idiomarina sp.]